MSYKRPVGTTANPRWQYAEDPVDLVPITKDVAGRGEHMLSLVGGVILTQGDAAGDRFGEHIQPWQSEYIRYLFGETDKAGNRIVKRSLIISGKGSGKSFLISAIALAHLLDLAKRRKCYRQTILIMAASVQSANIAFNHCLEAILIDPELKPLFKTQKIYRQLIHIKSGISIQVVAADLKNTIGIRTCALIVDELHAAGISSKDYVQVVDQARRGASNAAEEYLELMISTAPPSRSEGIFLKEYETFCKVRDGEVKDDTLLPVLFTYPIQRDDLDINDSSEWWRGCPGLGYTQPLAALEAEYQQAKLHGTSEDMSLFLSQRLNIMPADRAASTAWSVAAIWPSLPVKRLDEAGKLHRPSVGIDAGGAVDFFAITLAGFMGADDNAPLYCCTKQYVVKSHYDRFKPSLKPILDRAIAAGELVLCESTANIEKRVSEQVIAWLKDYGNLALIGGDRWGLAGFAERLESALFQASDYGSDFKFQDVKSNAFIGGAGNLLENMCEDRRVVHDGNSLLQWNLENVQKETDNRGFTRFLKKDEFGTQGERFLKIDGVISLVSAVHLLYAERKMEADVDFWIV